MMIASNKREVSYVVPSSHRNNGKVPTNELIITVNVQAKSN